MTADTLTAEERKALLERVGAFLNAREFHADDSCPEFPIGSVRALYALAKLATPELLALGEAAVADAKAVTTHDGLDRLLEAARAYAASVASIPTT